jgi:hypothetical protein
VPPISRLFLIGSIAMASLSATVHGAESSRKWTNTSGQSFDGSYVSSTTDKVSISRTDGKIFDVELSKLSKEDQDYLLTLKKGDATPTPAPPAIPAKKFKFKNQAGFVQKMLLGYDSTKLSNFTDPWPKEVGVDAEPPITVIEENPAEKLFIYESPHFHFQCNVLLRPSLLAKVALMFESTYKMHHDVPLNNRRTRADKAEKLKARLFETSAEYHAAGGPGGSAGVYMGGEIDEFLVPLDELGVKKVGSGYMFDYSGDFHTMYHELTHQMWADLPDCAGIWMIEGFAEFMACAPFSSGKFSFTKQQSYLMEYATGYGKKDHGGRALGKNITYPHLKDIMSWDQPTFYTNGNKNYGLGLLLVDFFVLFDGEGNKIGENFKNCIKACQEGKSAEQARQALLAGRSYDQLEKDFANGMKKKGLKISFSD